MTSRIRIFAERLRDNLWFVPGLIILGSMAAAWVMPRVDVLLDRTNGDEAIDPLLFQGDAENARLVLTTIASSMITVAGVVFSITIVALQMASSQFGPRLLRNFVRDRGNQFVLGIFLGTFLYCLLVTRRIYSADSAGVNVVPAASVTFGVMMAVLSLGVLIYFVHHVAIAIQAPVVVANVAAEMHGSFEDIFPGGVGEPCRERNETVERRSEAIQRSGGMAAATSTGYLQSIDGESLLTIAGDRDVCIRLARRPGQFVMFGLPVAHVEPADRCDESLVRKINAALVIGARRTAVQDPEFGVWQLVEVAMRALSPGIFDPHTAMNCVDLIGSGLAHLAQHEMPCPYRCDDRGAVRVIAYPPRFAGIVDAGITPLRQVAADNLAVILRILEMIEAVAQRVRSEDQRAALRRQAQWTYEQAESRVPCAADRAVLEERYRLAMRSLADQNPSAQTPSDADEHESVSV
jgi:uncharacterized membrane protein